MCVLQVDPQDQVVDFPSWGNVEVCNPFEPGLASAFFTANTTDIEEEDDPEFVHMDSDDAVADDASDDPAAMDEDDVAILGDQSGFSPMEAWVGAAGSATTLADPSFLSQLQAIDSAIISVCQQEALDARLGETDTSGSYDRAQEYPLLLQRLQKHQLLDYWTNWGFVRKPST